MYRFVRKYFDLGVGRSAEAFTGTGLPPVSSIRGPRYNVRGNLVVCAPAGVKQHRQVGAVTFLGNNGLGLSGGIQLQTLAQPKE